MSRLLPIVALLYTPLRVVSRCTAVWGGGVGRIFGAHLSSLASIVSFVKSLGHTTEALFCHGLPSQQDDAEISRRSVVPLPQADSSLTTTTLLFECRSIPLN